MDASEKWMIFLVHTTPPSQNICSSKIFSSNHPGAKSEVRHGIETIPSLLYCTVFSLCCPYHFVFYVLFFSICIFPLFPIFSLPFFPRVQLLCKLSCYLALIKDRFPRVLIAMEIFYTVQIQSYEVLQTKFAFFLN